MNKRPREEDLADGWKEDTKRRLWPGQVRTLCLGNICAMTTIHKFDRSEEESGVQVFEFKRFATEEQMIAVAVTALNRKLRIKYPANFPRDFREGHVIPPGPLSTTLEGIDTLSSAEEAEVLKYHQDIAFEFIQHLHEILKGAKLEVIDEIALVLTQPGSDSELYHRDGGRDDTNPRMIIYGSNEGPGTDFASGDCNLMSTRSDETRTRNDTIDTGFAPAGWKPNFEVSVSPEVGKAVLFTGNMCHRRQASAPESVRWGLLLDLQFEGTQLGQTYELNLSKG